MMKKTLMVAVASLAMLSAPAFAQKTPVNAAGGKGLVVVALNALNQSQIDLLRNANIEVLNDNTVQVPINVAATLCDIEVNAIASSNDQGNKSCSATAEGAEALAQ
jgi:type 1 fimbria pilin